MSQRAVLLSQCDIDGCGTTETIPMPAKKRAAIVLPKDWMHIRGDTATTNVFGIDVCPKHAQSIRESLALGKGPK